MRTIKQIVFIITTILILSSCDWLQPKIDPSDQIYQSAATLIHEPSSGKNIFITDDSLKLHPTEEIIIPDIKKDSLINKRYFITFQITEKVANLYTINLLSTQQMRELPIFTLQSINDTAKYTNQTLLLKSIWVSGSYLNMITEIKGSGDKFHNYNLLVSPSSSSDTLHLIMRYDNNKDNAIYTLQEATTYNIKKYINSDKDSVIISFDYNSYYPEYNTIYIKTSTK